VAITADQQAMLQLLLERGQSYGDLASLLGVEEDEVRSRARAALTELAGADPDRNVGLTDYLLGQADPIGRADAVRHLKDNPADLELATEISQKIRLIAPAAELPRLPGEERRPRTARSAGAARPRAALSRRHTQYLVGIGSAAVLALGIVLAVTGAFGGGDDETTAATTPATDGAQTRVALEPQSGARGSGTVTFGLDSGDSQPYVDVALDDLGPPPQGQAYVTWILLQDEQGYPLVLVAPCSSTVPQPCLSDNGNYQNRIVIQAPLLAVIARVRAVEVSLAPVEEITDAINKAIKDRTVVVQLPGTTVLRGEIRGVRGGGRGSSG
jgi:hypothetical protein